MLGSQACQLVLIITIAINADRVKTGQAGCIVQCSISYVITSKRERVRERVCVCVKGLCGGFVIKCYTQMCSINK